MLGLIFCSIYLLTYNVQGNAFRTCTTLTGLFVRYMLIMENVDILTISSTTITLPARRTASHACIRCGACMHVFSRVCVVRGVCMATWSLINFTGWLVRDDRAALLVRSDARWARLLRQRADERANGGQCALKNERASLSRRGRPLQAYVGGQELALPPTPLLAPASFIIDAGRRDLVRRLVVQVFVVSEFSLPLITLTFVIFLLRFFRLWVQTPPLASRVPHYISTTPVSGSQ